MIPQHQDSWLTLEEFPDNISTEVPQFGNFCHRVMAFLETILRRLVRTVYTDSAATQARRLRSMDRLVGSRILADLIWFNPARTHPRRYVFSISYERRVSLVSFFRLIPSAIRVSALGISSVSSPAMGGLRLTKLTFLVREST